MPKSGMAAMARAYVQPANIALQAPRNPSLLFKCMAYVIASQRSSVTTDSVYMESWLANTVTKPAILHPRPEEFIMLLLFQHSFSVS
jgi:hypothetical protein